MRLSSKLVQGATFVSLLGLLAFSLLACVSIALGG